MVHVTVDSIENLAAHAEISIAFPVDRVLDVRPVDRGLGGLALTEVPEPVPWIKDYDAETGDGPLGWATRFDVSTWGLLAAHDRGQRVGGAVVAFDTAGLNRLEGRRDLAALWDIRVRAECRTAGVGTALFRAAETWARVRGCRTLNVETQNINVPACRFYLRMGCELRAIDRAAYPTLPNEVQLIWSKAL